MAPDGDPEPGTALLGLSLALPEEAAEGDATASGLVGADGGVGGCACLGEEGAATADPPAGDVPTAEEPDGLGADTAATDSLIGLAGAATGASAGTASSSASASASASASIAVPEAPLPVPPSFSSSSSSCGLGLASPPPPAAAPALASLS